MLGLTQRRCDALNDVGNRGADHSRGQRGSQGHQRPRLRGPKSDDDEPDRVGDLERTEMALHVHVAGHGRRVPHQVRDGEYQLTYRDQEEGRPHAPPDLAPLDPGRHCDDSGREVDPVLGRPRADAPERDGKRRAIGTALQMPGDDRAGNPGGFLISPGRQRSLDGFALHARRVARCGRRVPKLRHSGRPAPFRHNVVMTDDGLTLLAQAAAHGDDRALRELVVATQDSVLRLCAVLSSPSEAEDLAQETYLRALQALPRFRFDAPVRAWLFAIARNVCADQIRRRVRRRPIEQKVASPGETNLDLADVELGELVRALDDEKRTAFILTQVVGMSYEEAAAVCECPVGTIRSRVARARAYLASAVRQADAS